MTHCLIKVKIILIEIYNSNNNRYGNGIFGEPYSHVAEFWLPAEHHLEDAGLGAAVCRNLRKMISGGRKISQEARLSVRLVL
jgi:hypothetical protein